MKYVPIYLDGGGDPSFDQIDAYLQAHFNARAVYLSVEAEAEAGIDVETQKVIEAVASIARNTDDLNRAWADGVSTAGGPLLWDVLDTAARLASLPTEPEAG